MSAAATATAQLPPPLRHAEKARNATCAFATTVAALSVDAWKALPGVPASAGQTVLASVVQSHPVLPLQVVALGVGTKVVADALVADDADRGLRVADCHAEVLARRGFVLYLLAQVRACNAGRPSVFARDDANGLPNLVDGVHFHLYTSSAPCGNACMRRFAKVGTETYDASLGPLQWPTKQPHPPLQRICDEQVAVLCKAAAERSPDALTVAREQPEVKKAKHGPVVPPGTEPPGSVRATSRATCSDKMARWCAMGMHGALVQSVCRGDFRPLTITVGRKFCRPHMARAMCCRIADHVERHPVLLCTDVKLHEGGMDAQTGATFANVAVVAALRDGALVSQVLVANTGLLADGSACMVARASLLGAWEQCAQPPPPPPPVLTSDFARRYASAKARADDAYKARADALLSSETGLYGWPRRRGCILE